jgi:ribosomal protein S18 acetylase RimI-like enzyme
MNAPPLFTGSSYTVRPYTPGDEAAMYTVTATLHAADAGDLLGWTLRLEETLEAGGAAWVAARGKRVNGYAILAPVPGLPGVFELTGGVATPWQGRGLGTNLLAAVKADAPAVGARRLSCFVADLTGESGRFLLNRGFFVEHEECLLERDMALGLPDAGEHPELAVRTLPRETAVALFPTLYETSFAGLPWAQPYSAAETEALLDRADDLLFLVRGEEPVGFAWLETELAGMGRIEPFGIVADHQGRGYGAWLLRAALARLRERRVAVARLGLWRENTAAMTLYQKAGFNETSNWYYLAYDFVPD